MTRSALVLWLIMAGSAAAQPFVADDGRIRQYAYDPARPASIDVAPGFQTTVELAADEHIETVSVGDAAAWLITANKAANRLFVKASQPGARTNMTVITDRRTYLFDLRSFRVRDASLEGSGVPYLVRFTYPAPPAAAPTAPGPPERRNTAYVYTGSMAALPAEVFDDGRFTYFRWPEDVATPALFLVAADGAESLANYSQRGGYQVVEQLAPRFVLRNGKDVTTIVNRGWSPPRPGPGAPLPADAATARRAKKAAR